VPAEWKCWEERLQREQSSPCNRHVGLRDVEDPTFCIYSAHRWRQGCQLYAPAAIQPLPKKYSRYSFLLEAKSNPRPQCKWKEGFGQSKKISINLNQDLLQWWYCFWAVASCRCRLSFGRFGDLLCIHLNGPAPFVGFLYDSWDSRKTSDVIRQSKIRWAEIKVPSTIRLLLLC
jgi:hypothetical protein